MLEIQDGYTGYACVVEFIDKSKVGALLGSWMLNYFGPGVHAAPINIELQDFLCDIMKHCLPRVTISSGYRTPRHNTEISGADQSGHTMGMACDLSGPPDDLEWIMEKCLKEKVPGLMIHDTFIHVDFLPRSFIRDLRKNAAGEAGGIMGKPAAGEARPPLNEGGGGGKSPGKRRRKNGAR